ncbi:hypothetical protein BD410DRAFT_748247 [Rickenella mellea]|uniref:Uncharacterized protein n=1 Tax=Rickenella mellea TaxID=50990 RepID=A0A4Y7Q4F8_9AGAM|nr:hypothetical protein BD410DRAFT_748247 [Rickenella mellea]
MASPLSQPGAHTLPPETVAHIFMVGTYTNRRRDTVSFPLLVSHVSSYWRRLALSTPALWTTVFMTDASISLISRTLTWLSRSRPYPLQIYLDFRDTNWNWDEGNHQFRWNHMEQVLRILMPHMSRWQIFELLSDTWEPIYALLWHSKNQSAPILRTISLNRCNAYFVLPGEHFRPPALIQHIPLFSGNAPSLRNVILAGTHVNWTRSPLRNLAELDLRYHAQEVTPTIYEFIDILRSSPFLQKLTILGWVVRSIDAAVVAQFSGSIALQTLRELTFGCMDASYGSHVLSLLSVRTLSKLSLEDMASSLGPMLPHDSTPILSFFVQRSQSFRSVESLNVKGIKCGVRSFTPFIRVFTHLRYLSIDGVELSLVSDLVASHGRNDTPCPRLSHVMLRGISLHTARSFVRGRAQSHYPFTSVILELHNSTVAHIRVEQIGRTTFRIVPV